LATYTVIRVRKELSSDGSHRHIEGVCTDSNTHHTRAQVVASLDAGNIWKTSSGNHTATIHKVARCPRCTAAPYIETNPASTKQDNLENVPGLLSRWRHGAGPATGRFGNTRLGVAKRLSRFCRFPTATAACSNCPSDLGRCSTALGGREKPGRSTSATTV
jgi:hypothetical protein